MAVQSTRKPQARGPSVNALYDSFFKDWLRENPKRATDAARRAGNVAGIGRGAWHAGEGLVQTAKFTGRLLNPLDAVMSPPGQAAFDQLSEAGRAVADYAVQRARDPMRLVEEIRREAQKARVRLDSRATPQASTLSGELRRNFEIGMNQGEAMFEIGSLLVGGPMAKAVGRLADTRKLSPVSKFVQQGFTEKQANYLARPYPEKNKGHHYAPLRLGLPKTLSESEFNVLKPRTSIGDFYERHSKVDPFYWGSAIPAEHGGGSWSAKRLGFKTYNRLGRAWHGAPGALKARVGASALGTGSLVNDLEEEP